MEKEFPFGIDPTGFLPFPRRAAMVSVDGGPLVGFEGGATIANMVIQAHLMSPAAGEYMVINDTEKAGDYFSITGWDSEKRILRVTMKKTSRSSRRGFFAFFRDLFRR